MFYVLQFGLQSKLATISMISTLFRISTEEPYPNKPRQTKQLPSFVNLESSW